MKFKICILAIVAGLLSTPAKADPVIPILFTPFANGEVLNAKAGDNVTDITHTLLIAGTIGIKLTIFNNSLNYPGPGSNGVAVIYDTEDTTNHFDPDQQGPPWSTGNLPAGTTLGKIMIIQEGQLPELDLGSIVSSPNDANSGGRIIFEFDRALASWGFDATDVEGTEENSTITFYFNDGTSQTILFKDLPGEGGVTPLFGDNSANRFAMLSFGKGFNKVEYDLQGSIGIGNLYVTVPEPSTFTLLGVGLFGLGLIRRFKA